MAKPRGRKPAEDSKLPDPKDWKKCRQKGCQKYAVFLEDYCWAHLSDKSVQVESTYKLKIENWVEAGHSLDGANLQEAYLRIVNLQEAKLRGVNLKKAILYRANLNKAKLLRANLQETNLEVANLQEAELLGVNLQGADLRRAILQDAKLIEANLQGAKLWRANLKQANLQGANLQATDLWEADLQKAKLWMANLNNANFSEAILHGSYMSGVLLDDAKNLTWPQVEYTGEEKHEYWVGAEDAYRRLKNYFHQQGLYQDESKAYYREKLMAQRQAWKDRKFGSWFVLLLLNTLAGFGEKLWRTVVGAFATILIFSGIYWLAGKLVTNGGELITKFWHCLYFSVVTFATLGFGDISPALHSTGTQVAAVIEVILGYVFLGMLITIIARKFGR